MYQLTGDVLLYPSDLLPPDADHQAYLWRFGCITKRHTSDGGPFVLYTINVCAIFAPDVEVVTAEVLGRVPRS